MTTGAPKEVLKYLQEDLDSLNTYNTNQIEETPTETLTYKEISQNTDGTWTQNDSVVENPVKLPLDQKRADILDLENKIASFKESAAILDRKVLDLNNQINYKKSQIVSLVSSAVGLGCSVGVLSTNSDSLIVNSVQIGFGRTVYEDQAKNKVYSGLTDYTARNPFTSDSRITLALSNVGDGYGSITSNNDGSNVGTYRTVFTIGHPGGITATCVGYANSIDSIASELTSLRAQRDSYLTNLNTIKDGKLDEEIILWGEKSADGRIESLKTGTISLMNSIDSVPDFQ
jgi:uncharacterized protein YoxC